MANIFDKQTNEDLLVRVAKLSESSKPLWGKMNVSQMLLHCQKPMEVATGKLMLKRGLIGFLFGKMVKNNFLNKPEFKQNLPTVPEFKSATTPEFENERLMLMGFIKRFGDEGPAVIANKKHPFFGEMNDEEWGILNYKHLDHHLRQFGV